MNIRIKRTHPAARLPAYATDGAACFDLHAATVNGAEHLGDIVYPGHPVVVDTGLAFEIPEGYMLRIASRFGMRAAGAAIAAAGLWFAFGAH